MEQTQTRLVNLPIVGRIQHGEKIGNKITDYGYFIVKPENEYMKTYINKFNEQFAGKKYVDIEFFDDEPMSIKYARYANNTEICRCAEDSDKATLRVKGGWKQITCDKYDCEYRKRNDKGKSSCNRLAWIRFLVPSITTDRIFLMRITSQEAIDNLKDYIALQKIMGNSIKGKYTIFLKQVEQTNCFTETFNNFIVDILRTEDFISENPTLENTENKNKLSTANSKNVNSKEDFSKTQTNQIEISEDTANIKEVKQDAKEQKEKSSEKTNTKKPTKSKTKKEKEEPNKPSNNEDLSNKEDDKNKETGGNAKESKLSWDKIYALVSTYKDKVKDKNGVEKEYLIGKFYNNEDKEFNVLINPNDEEKIQNCMLGAMVKMDIKEFLGRQCAMKLELFDEQQKTAA